MRLFIFYTLIILTVAACNAVITENSSAPKKVRSPEQRSALWWQEIKDRKALINNGDLVTRTGADVISSSFCNFNKQDKTYSHSGLAFIEDGQPYVYHTLSGDENPGAQMIREPFDSFCNPVRKEGFGVFRYDLSTIENNALQVIIKDYYKAGMLFDTQFNLKDDKKMYCAELILKALKQSTQNRILLPTTTVRNFKLKNALHKNKTFKELEYVAIDNLYMNSFCKEIARVKFD